MPPAEPTGGAGPGGKPKKCPICGKPAQEPTLPFCSPRCRNVDLNRWFSGSYVIPASESDDEDPE